MGTALSRSSSPVARRTIGTLLVCVLWMSCLLALSSRPAHAHKRNFAWSYEWFTPVVGEKETEVWLTSKDGGSTWQKQLEYEFAPSERHAVGLYLISENEGDGPLGYKGWKVENRYRFGELEDDRWLHAAYLEVKKETGEPYELEGKWLLSRYNARGDALAVNLIAEKELTSGADVEWGYSAGWNRQVGKRMRLGAEAFGEFANDAHWLGPNLAYDYDPHLRLVMAAGAPLTDEADAWAFRAIAEYEW